MEIPELLVDDIFNRRCFPFVGAGFSLNAEIPDSESMPDWDGLISLLAEDAQIPSDLGNFEVATLYEDEFRRPRLIQKLRTFLLHNRTKPGGAHRSLVKIGFRIIYTTNFDVLLEEACRLEGIEPNTVVREEDFSISPERYMTSIVKMHGCLNIGDVTLTQDDYDDYMQRHPVCITHLSNMFVTETPMFIGYSRRDPHFRHVRSIVKRNLGAFTRQSFFIGCDINEWDQKLLRRDQIYPLSLERNGRSYGETLAEFFESLAALVRQKEAQDSIQRSAGSFEHPPGSQLRNLVESTDEKTAATLLSGTSKICYITMSENVEARSILMNNVLPLLDEYQFDIVTPGRDLSSPDEMRSIIQQAKIIVAVINNKDPGVSLDLSFAQRIGKPIVLCSKEKLRLKSILPSEVYNAYQSGSIPVVRMKMGLKVILKPPLADAIDYALGSSSLTGLELLIEKGSYIEVIVRIGLLIEITLRSLIQSSKILPHNADARMNTVSRMLELLEREKIIDHTDSLAMRRIWNERNKSVHERGLTLTRTEIILFYEDMKRFVSKYLGEDFWKNLVAQEFG